MSKMRRMGAPRTLAIGLAAAATHAEVTCTNVDGTGTCTVTDLGSDEYDVTIVATSSNSEWRITADAEGDKIRNILVTPGGTGTAKTRLTIKGTDAKPRWLESVERIDPASGSESKGLVFIDELFTNGDVGTITAPRAVLLDIGGDLTGGIDTIDPDDTEEAIVDLVVGGDILGDITISDGRVDDIEVSGDIGTAATPVTISCLQTIREIEASAIYADITVTGNGVGEGLIRRIETTGGTAGDFTGSITCEEFSAIIGGVNAPGLFVDDDLNADVTINGDFQHDIDVSGDLADEKLIRIAGELTSAATITLGASGLIGQIIINAANGTDTWDGDVIVGTTTLSTTPYYSDTGLGGGAVGEARFGFHKTDSVPAWDSTVTDAVPTEVKIVHYGPVHITTLGGGVIKVEKNDNIGGGWIDVSSDFTVDATTAHTGFTRDIRVKPKAGKAYLDDHSYRLSIAAAGKLECSFVDDCPTNCPDVNWQETYFKFEIDVN